mgnify:CR=1 FL=1
MDCVHPDYRIDSIKGTGTPGLYFRENTVGYAADGLCGYAVAELFFQYVADLTSTGAYGIKTYYPVCQRVCEYLFSLSDNLRVKGSVSVAGSAYGNLAHGSLHLLAYMTITAVAEITFSILQMTVHLALKGTVQQVL